MTKKLAWFLKGTIYYLLTVESTAIMLYARACLILGRAPKDESEEARSFGLRSFIDVFEYFYMLSTLVLPLSIILLLFLVFRYKYRPTLSFAILIFITYLVSVSGYFIGNPRIGVWIIG